MSNIEYASVRTLESRNYPGVSFTIRKMSFARRQDLIRDVRQASRELEFRSSGESAEDRLAAAAIHSTVETIYIRWGLERLEGLRIDGVEADAEALLTRGPEALCYEIASAIRRECGLTDEERKN